MCEAGNEWNFYLLEKNIKNKNTYNLLKNKMFISSGPPLTEQYGRKSSSLVKIELWEIKQNKNKQKTLFLAPSLGALESDKWGNGNKWIKVGNKNLKWG